MSGPWLQAAVLCERVAGDETGRLAALNLVDSVELEGGQAISMNLVVAVVREDWTGPIKLRIVAIDPAGEPLAAIDAEGDPPPIPYAQSRIVVPIELQPGREGAFWFAVQLADQTVTRVPLWVAWRAAAT